MKNFKNSIKEYLKGLSKKMIITIILTLSVAGYLAVRAAFVEPSAAPASSDQDFTENVMGANNADNDFSSSSVASNRDGSILERLEYAFGGSCGDGSVGFGEACDDGGTSWTSGACAGDCSRRNYWSSPSAASYFIGAGTDSLAENANAYCQQRNFRIYTSVNTTTGAGLANYKSFFESAFSVAGTTTASATAAGATSYSISRTISYFSSQWRLFQSTTGTSSVLENGGANASTYRYFSDTYLSQPSSSAIISEIWCAD